MTATNEQITAMTRALNNASERLPVLWQLAQEWDRLLSLLEDPESNQDAIQLELQQVAGDIRIKGHGLAIVVEALDNLTDWQRKQSQRLMTKARANEAHAERLKTYALSCMQSLGIERLEMGTHTLSVRSYSHVEVADPAQVPSEYQRTTITVDVDKRAILAAYRRDGEIVPGAEVVQTSKVLIS